MSVEVGCQGERVRELEMGGFDAFYERLREDPELPTTSQPSIGDFLEVWEPLIESGHDVVSVHLAGGISGTCEAARQAHGLLGERGLGERVEVIDGETGCGGLRRCWRRRPRHGRARRRRRCSSGCAAHSRCCLVLPGHARVPSPWGRIGKAQAWLGGTLKTGRSRL